MDLLKAREKFAEINLKEGFYTQEELETSNLGVFDCNAAEQDFEKWWDCLIYYVQPLIDQKEKTLLEQFEINNKLVEQIEKLKGEALAHAKAKAIPAGYVLVPKEPTSKILQAMKKANDNGIHATQIYRCGLQYKAMIEAAQRESHD